MKWRPIKTAPLNELILLSCINGERTYTCVGRWVDVPHTNEVTNVAHCSPEVWKELKDSVVPNWEEAHVGIMLIGGPDMRSWEARSHIVYPTHWMPLPSPCKKAKP